MYMFALAMHIKGYGIDASNRAMQKGVFPTLASNCIRLGSAGYPACASGIAGSREITGDKTGSRRWDATLEKLVSDVNNDLTIEF